ncbi:MAG TPA: sulfotransferase [Arenimonas sp.]|nr:sulfotransferase [Arenimonas sp.]
MTRPLPADVEHLRRQAHAALQAGRTGHALAALRAACAAAPDAAILHCELGRVLAVAGQAAQAREAFANAARLEPGMAEAWHFLGLSLGQAGQADAAIAPLRRAHALAPGNPRTLELLAQAEFEAGDPADALPLWQALYAQRPGDETVLLRLGETLNRLDRAEQARALYADGLARLPASPGLCIALAQTEEILGHRDAAEAAYRQALALQPGWAYPLAGLLGLRRGQAAQADLDQAERLLAGKGLDDADRALLGYEVGKVHDARGDYRLAMAAWDDANAARRRQVGEPDVAALERRVEASLAFFDRARLARAGELGDADARPVFVVGMPRSGTTLLERIVGAHPLAFAAGELPDLSLIARQLPHRRGQPEAWPHIPEDVAPEDIAPAARRYLAALTRQAPSGARRVLDKYPMNYYLLGLAGLMFPNARIIWCRRDPRDVAVSIYGENFALAERLATRMDGIGHLVRLQERMMAHWRQVLPQPVLELHYEQLASDPEAQARRVLEFLGLPWDPACLRFHEQGGGVQTPSRWQVRQPVHTRSIGRWRHYEFALGPLLQALGRNPDTDAGAPPTPA